MDNVIFIESYLKLYEAKSQLETVISIIDTFYESSGQNTKTGFTKLKESFNNYTTKVKNLCALYSSKRQVKKNLKVMKKVIESNPDLAKEKVTYRTFADFTDDLDYDIKMSKNLAYRIDNLDKKWMTDLMNSYYKNMDSTGKYLKKVTIKESIEYTEEVISNIDKAIEKEKKMVSRVADQIDGENITPEHVGMFKNLVTTIYKSIQSRIYIMMYNVEILYMSTIDKIQRKIDDESERLVVKKITKSYNTIQKNSKKIDTVEIFGTVIELYETDKYIESEFVTGADHPRVYFDKDFKKLTPAYQKAILYHEYGHVINGHLGTLHYRDEYKLDKKISRRVKKYLKKINAKKEDLASDDLLIYLLIELEADEFSAKFVGNNVVKKSLEHDYIDLINKATDLSEEAKLNTLSVGQLRSSML